jgi:hypothetical protein
VAYHALTKEFLTYLRGHPAVRNQIRAAPGKTLLYAGAFFMPMWRQIEADKRRNPQLREKETLPEVLRRVPAPGTRFASLSAYVSDHEPKVPKRPDGDTIWRALSGIFASNAVGAVSFQVGDHVTPDKVLVSTELSALARNPSVDALTRDLVAYYQRCARNKQEAMNFGFIAG